MVRVHMQGVAAIRFNPEEPITDSNSGAHRVLRGLDEDCSSAAPLEVRIVGLKKLFSLRARILDEKVQSVCAVPTCSKQYHGVSEWWWTWRGRGGDGEGEGL